MTAKSPQSAGLLDAGLPLAAIRLDVKTWRATDIVNGIIPAVEITAPVKGLI